MASDFDATPLHNVVHENIGEDDQLAELLDATVRAEYAQEQRKDELGDDAEYLDDIDRVAGRLSYVAQTRAREVVAEACGTVIDEADDWVSEGNISKQSAEDAQQEAREWLQSNTDVSGRLGLLEKVTV